MFFSACVQLTPNGQFSELCHCCIQWAMQTVHLIEKLSCVRLSIERHNNGMCAIEMNCNNLIPFYLARPPLWSSGQSFWLQIQRSRVRSAALPDFLSSSGSGTGSTQPREVNWGATWMKKSSGSRYRKQRLTAVGTRCADHVTPLYPQKLALTSPTCGGRSVGIVRVRTKATEFRCIICVLCN